MSFWFVPKSMTLINLETVTGAITGNQSNSLKKQRSAYISYTDQLVLLKRICLSLNVILILLQIVFS